MLDSQAGRRFRPTYTLGSNPTSSHKDLFSLLPKPEPSLEETEGAEAALRNKLDALRLEALQELTELDTSVPADIKIEPSLADSVAVGDERALAEVRRRLPEL